MPAVGAVEDLTSILKQKPQAERTCGWKGHRFEGSYLPSDHCLGSWSYVCTFLAGGTFNIGLMDAVRMMLI